MMNGANSEGADVAAGFGPPVPGEQFLARISIDHAIQRARQEQNRARELCRVAAECCHVAAALREQAARRRRAE
jgi:hypothetical protein